MPIRFDQWFSLGTRSGYEFRTATPAINHGKRRHSAALSEYGVPFLNGAQRSVNRKVQGSNPWSGANCKFEMVRLDQRPGGPYYNRTATALQLHYNWTQTWSEFRACI